MFKRSALRGGSHFMCRCAFLALTPPRFQFCNARAQAFQDLYQRILHEMELLQFDVQARCSCLFSVSAAAGNPQKHRSPN